MWSSVGQVVGCCEGNSELSGSIKWGEFCDWLRTCYLKEFDTGSERASKHACHSSLLNGHNLAPGSTTAAEGVRHVTTCGAVTMLSHASGSVQTKRSHKWSAVYQTWPTWDPWGTYLWPLVTWIVSIIQFNKHDVTDLQNIAWQFC